MGTLCLRIVRGCSGVNMKPPSFSDVRAGLLDGSKSRVTLEVSMSSAEPSSEEVARNPALFADWINEYLVLSPSFEDDLGCAPSKEQGERLKISDKERIFCANEFVLLRALGACLFVRHNLDEKYYLAFRNALLSPVLERMNRNAPYGHHDDPVSALDDYLEALKSDSHVAFSCTYVDRVYPFTSSSDSIFLNGIPVNVGFKLVMLTFEKVRDGFYLLLTGRRYEEQEESDPHKGEKLSPPPQ